MLESFEGREFYENKKEKLNQKIKEQNMEKQKVLAGKKTLKNFFKSTSKESQVEEIEQSMANVNISLYFRQTKKLIRSHFYAIFSL